MAALGGVSAGMEYEGGLVLKGRNIAFVSTARTGNSVQRHCFEGSQDELHYYEILERFPHRLFTGYASQVPKQCSLVKSE